MTDVPQGTAQEVLDWVGSDPARAQEALYAEYERPTPRSTLIAKLEPINAAQEEPMSDETVAEPELAPAPEAPSGEDLSIDLADRATHIGPANVLNDEVAKPEDSFDLVAAQAQADDEEAPVDATAVEFFQLASNGGVVVLNFDGNSVLLDANQAAALSKDLKTALAGVTY